MKIKYLRRRIIAATLALVLLSGVAYLNRAAIRDTYDSITGADYAGSGSGAVILKIEPGDDGAIVAQNMVDLGIVKSYRKIYQLFVEREFVFYPGSYQLRLKMSSPDAVQLLADPASRVANRVTIREGLRIKQVFAELTKQTKIPIDDFVAAAKDLESLGIPISEVSAEGWLFPATYNFDPDLNAGEILKQMVSRTKQELERFGVAEADRHRVLTLAALIQKEARIASDFYKVSRVFLNRIEKGMLLQSDATVSYGVGGNTVSTSAADRANRNGYNTYLYPGLPIGPIGAPGSTAIDAAINPAQGDWLFFCTVNLESGETMFSETYAQHQAAVRIWQAWMRENPGYE